MKAHALPSHTAPPGATAIGRTPNHAALLLAVAIVLAGCSGGPTSVKEELTPAEVRGFVEVLDAVYTFDLGYDGANPWMCPEGGSVSYRAAYGWPGDTLTIEGYEDFHNCGGRSGAGQSFSLGGHPEFLIAMEVDNFGAILKTEDSVTGELSWRTGGRAGSCQLDLAETSDSAGRRVSGNVCGLGVSQILD